MRLYAITDRRLYPGDEGARTAALLQQAGCWARAGVECIQLREKDLPAKALAELTRELVQVTHLAAEESGGRDRPRSRVLVNFESAEGGAVEIARKGGADGLHLTGAEAFGGRAYRLQERVRALREEWPGSMVSVACHAVEEAEAASRAGVSLVLYAPVFEKQLRDSVMQGAGLAMLGRACEAAAPVPVFALGGVTVAHAGECLAAGAAGIAGIRLFLGEGWMGLVGSERRHGERS